MTDHVDKLGFIDFETRAERGAKAYDANVKTAGTYRYAEHAFATVLAFAVGDGPVSDYSLNGGFDGDWLTWDDAPDPLREFHKRVEQREAWYCAWNAGFDRTVWNRCTADFPVLEPDMVIDAMSQAVASNLPAGLEGASRSIGRPGKQDDGKKLIELFSYPNGGTPQSHPAEWTRFKSYGRQDVAEMREVFRATRPLPLAEWEDYWISEKINARGIGIDRHFVERCAAIAAASARRDNELLRLWTNGQITAVTQSNRIAEWVYDRLEFTEAQNLLVKEWDEDASTEDDIEGDLKPGKLSIARDRIAAVLAFFDDLAKSEPLTERDQLIVDVLTTRQFGGSSSPGKFQKMLDQETGGRLRGMYVFNGAAQTGRFSSKGVQTHNLMRASLKGDEIAALEMINGL